MQFDPLSLEKTTIGSQATLFNKIHGDPFSLEGLREFKNYDPTGLGIQSKSSTWHGLRLRVHRNGSNHIHIKHYYYQHAQTRVLFEIVAVQGYPMINLLKHTLVKIRQNPDAL